MDNLEGKTGESYMCVGRFNPGKPKSGNGRRKGGGGGLSGSRSLGRWLVAKYWCTVTWAKSNMKNDRVTVTNGYWVVDFFRYLLTVSVSAVWSLGCWWLVCHYLVRFVIGYFFFVVVLLEAVYSPHYWLNDI